MRRFLVVFLLVLTLLAVSLGTRELILPAGPPAETFVEVVPGMGSRTIAAVLAEHGIIRSRYAFDLWHVLRGGTLKAGEYRFDQPATLPAVYNRLVRGDVYTRTVTIPEGFNLFDIAQAVQDAQLGSKESFLAAASQDVALIADLDPGAKNLEGYLFPDTYRFQRHQPPSQLLAAMVRRFRQSSASIGLEGDYHRIVTLASLVEKETPVAEDRPLVASVLAESSGQGHAPDDRPHGDLRRHAGEAIPGDDLSVRPEAGLGLQHLPPYRPAAGADLQPGSRIVAGGDASCREQVSLFCCRCRAPPGTPGLPLRSKSMSAM